MNTNAIANVIADFLDGNCTVRACASRIGNRTVVSVCLRRGKPSSSTGGAGGGRGAGGVLVALAGLFGRLRAAGTAPTDAQVNVAFKKILDRVGIENFAALCAAFYAVKRGEAPSDDDLALAKDILGEDDPVVAYAERLRGAVKRTEEKGEAEEEGRAAETEKSAAPAELPTDADFAVAFKKVLDALGFAHFDDIAAAFENLKAGRDVGADTVSRGAEILGWSDPVVKYAAAVHKAA